MDKATPSIDGSRAADRLKALKQYNKRQRQDQHTRADIQRKAREAGLSYGQYVARYGQDLPGGAAGAKVRKLTCPACGQQFETTNRKQVYCDAICCARARAQRQKVHCKEQHTRVRICPVCGKEFETTNHKYCSDGCASQAKSMQTKASRERNKKSGRVVLCTICGKEFETTRGNKKYCGPACAKEAHYRDIKARRQKIKEDKIMATQDKQERSNAQQEQQVERSTDNAPYPQDTEANEYRYINPFWIDAIARGLTAGELKHPGATWRTIPQREHIARAIRHLNMALMGDTTDDHLVNASMRVMMAFVTGKEGDNNAD